MLSRFLTLKDKIFSLSNVNKLCAENYKTVFYFFDGRTYDGACLNVQPHLTAKRR